MSQSKKRTAFELEEDNRNNRSPEEMMKIAKKATRRESNRLDKVVDELRLVEKKVAESKGAILKKFTDLATAEDMKKVYRTMCFFSRGGNFVTWVDQLVDSVYEAPGAIYSENHSCPADCEHSIRFYNWLFSAFKGTQKLQILIDELLKLLPRDEEHFSKDSDLKDLTDRIANELALDPFMKGLGYEHLRYVD